MHLIEENGIWSGKNRVFDHHDRNSNFPINDLEGKRFESIFNFFPPANYRWFQLFLPYSPGHPQGHHCFLGCPGLLIILFLPCTALINHFNCLFSSSLSFFITHFSMDPGGMREEQYVLCIKGIKLISDFFLEKSLIKLMMFGISKAIVEIFSKSL